MPLVGSAQSLHSLEVPEVLPGFCAPSLHLSRCASGCFDFVSSTCARQPLKRRVVIVAVCFLPDLCLSLWFLVCSYVWVETCICTGMLWGCFLTDATADALLPRPRRINKKHPVPIHSWTRAPNALAELPLYYVVDWLWRRPEV